MTVETLDEVHYVAIPLPGWMLWLAAAGIVIAIIVLLMLLSRRSASKR